MATSWRYKIEGREFSTKKDVENVCKNIRDKKGVRNITGEDLKFMKKIFAFHPNQDKMKKVRSIFVDSNLGNSFFIKYYNGTMDDVSYIKCLKYMPIDTPHRIDYVFKWGKYKGKSIYKINDENYLHGTLLWDRLWRRDRVLIGQFLRYGYIPYNPAANRGERV